MEESNVCAPTTVSPRIENRNDARTGLWRAKERWRARRVSPKRLENCEVSGAPEEQLAFPAQRRTIPAKVDGQRIPELERRFGQQAMEIDFLKSFGVSGNKLCLLSPMAVSDLRETRRRTSKTNKIFFFFEKLRPKKKKKKKTKKKKNQLLAAIRKLARVAGRGGSARRLREDRDCCERRYRAVQYGRVLWSLAYRSNPQDDVHIEPYRSIGHAPKSGPQTLDSTMLIDATLKYPMPPVALPKREFMERALEIWKQLDLPALRVQQPWHGYSLGDWSEALDAFACNAVSSGEWAEKRPEHISAPPRRSHPGSVRKVEVRRNPKLIGPNGGRFASRSPRNAAISLGHSDGGGMARAGNHGNGRIWDALVAAEPWPQESRNRLLPTTTDAGILNPRTALRRSAFPSISQVAA